MKETTAPKDKPAQRPAHSPVAGPTLADEAAVPERRPKEGDTSDPDDGFKAPLVPTPLPPLGH